MIHAAKFEPRWVANNILSLQMNPSLQPMPLLSFISSSLVSSAGFRSRPR